MSKLFVVVNFAVEYDPNRAVFVANRLMAMGQINDAQAAAAKANAAVDVNTFVIGSPVADGLHHGAYIFCLYASIVIYSTESAHRNYP